MRMLEVKFAAVKISCAAMLMLVAGCSTIESWNPFASKDKSKNLPSELVEFKSTMVVKTVWETSIGDGERYLFSPALIDDAVYAASANGNITRLDAATGKVAWRIDAGLPLSAGVGADGDTIAVAGDKGDVLAFDTAGKLRWKAQASSEVLSAPAVGSGLVIVRSVDNRISAYEIATGARKWVLQRTVPTLMLRNAPGITITAKAAYVALPGGRIIALSLNSGVVLWEGVVGDPKGATELERIADSSGTPMLIERDVCTIAYQGKVACFDATNGSPRWSKDMSSYVGIGLDERFVFAADEKGNVNALTRDNGVSVWRNGKLGYRRLSTPFSFGRAVVVGDYQGFIHFLSREDGAFLARVKTDKGAIFAAPVTRGAHLIFQTQSGTMVALSTE
jgi:outer membrane protein assembly factor BamB